MRYFYLDSMRSVLMILGVFYHAALIFALDEDWRVVSPQRSLAFNALAETIHTFRMPAFFIVAGFFALFTLRRRSAGHFTLTRAQRLLIPFVATFLLLNPFQFVLTEALTPGRHRWGHIFSDLQFWEPSGDTVSHLWFLPHLFAFGLVLMGLIRLARAARSVRLPWIWRERARWLGGTFQERGLHVALMPLGLVLIYILDCEARDFSEWEFQGLLDMYKIMVYLPFFLFGALMFHSPALTASFFRIRRWHLAAFAAALLFVGLAEQTKSLTPRNLIHAYSRGVLMWGSCVFCFCLFKRFLDRPSRLFAYLSDASYSIYLFHQVFVVFFGMLLLTVPIGIYFKYALIVLGSLAVALGLHHFLVLRFSLLRLLFNGKFGQGRGGDPTSAVPASASSLNPLPISPGTIAHNRLLG